MSGMHSGLDRHTMPAVRRGRERLWELAEFGSHFCSPGRGTAGSHGGEPPLPPPDSPPAPHFPSQEQLGFLLGVSAPATASAQLCLACMIPEVELTAQSVGRQARRP